MLQSYKKTKSSVSLALKTGRGVYIRHGSKRRSQRCKKTILSGTFGLRVYTMTSVCLDHIFGVIWCIHVVDVEVFLRISDSFDLLVLLDEKFGDNQS